MAASSSSSGPCWKNDVFLNFRGKDTRRGFVSHLYRALCEKSINTFIDAKKLRKGDRLSKLMTAIRESRISIVVFSRNYASSIWCLRELVEILECKDTKDQIVLPIFYGVEPSRIRRLKRRLARAFTKHNVKEVQSWSSALAEASKICGWESQKSMDDAELVEKIVEDVLEKINKVEMNDVCVVGIWGVGDLGKITTAGAVYFDSLLKACDFLEEVGKGFMKHGKLHVQAQLLSRIPSNGVGSSDISNKGLQGLAQRKLLLVFYDVDNLEQVMLNSLGQRKLIVSYDVDNLEQVEALLGVGEQHSFGDGSRIFITFSRGSGCTKLISTWIRSSIMEQSIRPSVCVCKYVAGERNHEDIAVSTPFANLRTPPVVIQFG